jgi:hypothetical protein
LNASMLVLMRRDIGTSSRPVVARLPEWRAASDRSPFRRSYAYAFQRVCRAVIDRTRAVLE